MKIMSVKKITSRWKRKEVKRVVRKAKAPIFGYKAMKDIDNVRIGGIKTQNRVDAKSEKHSKKRSKN